MGVDAKMVVRLAAPISDEALVDASYRLSEACGAYRTFLLSNDEDMARGEQRRALNRVTDDEDGEYHGCHIADVDGLWLWLSLCGRYYGVGYERGDLFQFIEIAEWLERNFPGCLVFYGGYSSESIAPFNKPARERFIAHWAENGGRPYYAGEGTNQRWVDPPHPLRPMCPLCQKPPTQYGSGGKFASWTCDGCSRHWVWTGGDVKAFPPSTDFNSFDAAKAMREAATERVS